jgi:hypothetical protein
MTFFTAQKLEAHYQKQDMTKKQGKFDEIVTGKRMDLEKGLDKEGEMWYDVCGKICTFKK